LHVGTQMPPAIGFLESFLTAIAKETKSSDFNTLFPGKEESDRRTAD